MSVGKEDGEFETAVEFENFKQMLSIEKEDEEFEKEVTASKLYDEKLFGLKKKLVDLKKKSL